MKKSKTESIQYQPYVTINRERVRPIKNDNSFTYLGKDFSFNMNCDHVKENLMKTIRDYTNRKDTLPIHLLCKTEICQKYVYSKIKWDLSIYDLSESWVKENIDSYLNQLYRKWLQLPISANITHLQMPQNKLGLTIKSTKKLYNKCNYQFVESLKRHQISKPENFTKSQGLNTLIQTQ